MKQLASTYSLSGAAVTMTGVNVPLSQILLVSDATTGSVLYSMAGPAASSYTQATNSVITLATTPTSTDKLTIYYDDGVAPANAPTVQLGSGVVTATTQRVTLATDGPEVTNSTAIKNSTANLDVALSTRLKPSDTLTAVTTVGSLTNALPTGGNIIGATNRASGSITMSASSVGTTSAPLLAANSATKMLVIQNTSANILYIAGGAGITSASSTTGILISAGAGYEFPFVPTNALYCIGSAASTTYSLWYA